ncbi:glycine cleavage system transcriptional repressor, partial [Acinetobacter baumannii]|nr:glycine cleavage system transcriptional repressor [Acinetobacter baumannii]
MLYGGFFDAFLMLPHLFKGRSGFTASLQHYLVIT